MQKEKNRNNKEVIIYFVSKPVLLNYNITMKVLKIYMVTSMVVR